jgi:putative transposase
VCPQEHPRTGNLIRTECLDHFVIFGQPHLRRLIAEFMGHYLTERHHQGIGGQIIRLKPSPGNDNAALGAIGRQSRLGGLLNYYCEAA